MALFQKSSAHDRRPFEESRVKGVDCHVAGQQRHPRFHGQRGLTGTPVVGGLSTWQAQSILRRLGPIHFVGMDLVEVAPPYDHAEITALAGASLLLDYFCLRAKHLISV